MKIYTIRDIAKLAGVSVTTVSRVLNHRPDVNAATREKVERVMAECNFVGNANARSLKQLDGDVAALILRGRSNPFLSQLAEIMLQFAAETGVSFFLETIDEKDDEFQTALRLTHEKRARGFIFVGSRLDSRTQVLRGVEAPLVFATVPARELALPRVASRGRGRPAHGPPGHGDADPGGAPAHRHFRRQPQPGRRPGGAVPGRPGGLRGRGRSL